MALIAGRERLNLSRCYRNGAYNPVAIDEYVYCYAAEGGPRAGFDDYCALFTTMEQTREDARTPLEMSVLAPGGAASSGESLPQSGRSTRRTCRRTWFSRLSTGSPKSNWSSGANDSWPPLPDERLSCTYTYKPLYCARVFVTLLGRKPRCRFPPRSFDQGMDPAIGMSRPLAKE